MKRSYKVQDTFSFLDLMIIITRSYCFWSSYGIKMSYFHPLVRICKPASFGATARKQMSGVFVVISKRLGPI